MRRIVLTLAVLGAAVSLAACSKKEPATAEATTPLTGSSPTPAAGAEMPTMPMAADAKPAKGAGTVTAVSADSVTIDHQPIPEANWPAMTMAFKASPEIARQVKPGDKVAFDLQLQGGGGEITAITKQ